VPGPVQGRSDKRNRPCAIESSYVSKSYERSDGETLAQRRKIARICSLFEAYTGERAWKSIGDRFKGPNYLSRDDHDRKIRARKQEKSINTP
jgi:hypothetical protein